MKKFVLFFTALFIGSAALPAGAAGWYLRGTLGFEWSLAADYSDADSGATNPPALFGVNLGSFQPYLGGGVGVAHNWLSEMTYDFPGNPGAHKITITPAGKNTDVAFMTAVGTGIVLSRSTLLDIAYRYTDLGRVYTDTGKAHLNNIPAGIEIAETWAPLRTHGVFAGIRYLFP